MTNKPDEKASIHLQTCTLQNRVVTVMTYKTNLLKDPFREQFLKETFVSKCEEHLNLNKEMRNVRVLCKFPRSSRNYKYQ